MKTRHLLLFVALGVLTSSTPARAASISVGFDGGPAMDVTSLPMLVVNPGDSSTVDIYLNLDAGEEASVFEAAFLYEAVGFVVSFDPLTNSNESRVDPGKMPFGVGTWPGAAGLLTSTEGRVSLLSNNMGGERLVASFGLMLPTDAPADSIFAVSLGPNAIVAMDVTGGLIDIPLTTPAGTPLARVVPEPGTAFLVAIGLLGLGQLRRKA